MFKYVLFIIIGILLYKLLNRRDGFSIGIPGGQLNDVCRDAEPKCEPGFYCQYVGNTCQVDLRYLAVPGMPDQDCRDAEPKCYPGLDCINDKCRTEGTADPGMFNQDCRDAEPKCDQGLYCSRDNTCQENPEPGMFDLDCLQTEPKCDQGLDCVDGKCRQVGGGATGGGATGGTEGIDLRRAWFFNAGDPISIKCIHFEETLSEVDINASMTKIFEHFKELVLPPIYLGEFRKESERMFGSQVRRHFFIINGEIYYFELVHSANRNVLITKNFGERNRHPILLYHHTTRWIIPRYDIVAASRTSNSYLRIGAINEANLVINLYPTNDDVRGDISSELLRVQNILRAYSLNKSTSSEIRSCAVSSTGVISATLDALSHTGPMILSSRVPIEGSSIDMSDTGMTICESFNSVYKLNDLNNVIINTGFDKRSLVLSNVPKDATEPYTADELLVQATTREALPVLQYNSIVLKYMKLISNGSFGSVYCASNIPFEQFNSVNDTGDAAIAVAVKIYRLTDDPEIEIIRNINTIEGRLDNCLQLGEIINSIILTDPRGQNIAIMRYMDGDMVSFYSKSTYDPKSNLPFKILDRLMIIALCVHRVGYEYFDLKLLNMLYMCYEGNKLVISFGDLGSLQPIETAATAAISGREIGLPIRPINTVVFTDGPIELYDAEFNLSKALVYMYGLMILQFYKIVDYFNMPDEDDDASTSLYKLNPIFAIQAGRLDMTDDLHNRPQFYTTTGNTITDIVHPRLDILKNGTNDSEIQFIKDLLDDIFRPPLDRITLEQIGTRFTIFKTNAPPAPLAPVPEGIPPGAEQPPQCRTLWVDQCNLRDDCSYNNLTGVCGDML